MSGQCLHSLLEVMQLRSKGLLSIENSVQQIDLLPVKLLGDLTHIIENR